MLKPSLKRVEALFHQAAELAPDQRSTFLNTHCAGDTELRAAVQELLSYDTGSGGKDSFLASPISRVIAPETPGGLTLPTIPGYELLEELGRGGMGVVYKARQTALNRLVALKMVLSGPAITAEHLARFRTEAEALARLQHPHIVQIFDVGELEERPYFSMQYVAGPSLAHRLGGVPQPAGRAAQLVEVIARAVHAVHRCGIIHRDLKPANILLQPKGGTPSFTSAGTNPKREVETARTQALLGLRLDDFEPKVSDFGLAKLVKDQPHGRNLTEPGQAMGTPSYMAPEQAWGKAGALGPATDVYALGAILYELLTGHPPFEGEMPTETILQLLSQEPVPPTQLRPTLPRDLETICLKCLEKEPRKRYASAEVLAEDLRRFQAGEPIQARPVSAAERVYRWSRRHPLVVALLAVTASLALALVATILVYNARLQEALAQSLRTAEDERQQLVQRNGEIGMRHLENGETFIGLLWLTEALRVDPQQEEKHRIRIGTALQHCPRLVQLLVLDEPVLDVRPSAAGSWLITTGSGRGLRVWDVGAGEPVRTGVQLDADVLRAAVSRDGGILATTSTDNLLRIWNTKTGKPFLPPLPQQTPVRKVSFDSRSRILLTLGNDFVVQLWDLVRNVPLSLQDLPKGKPSYSTFSEDGKWVFMVDSAHAGRVWDTTNLKTIMGPLKLERDVIHATFSPNGRFLALVEGDNQVRIWDVSSGGPVCGPLTHPDSVRDACFSLQGDRLLTTGDDDAARIWQVATGKLLRPLRHDGLVTCAQFSPDGQLVVSAGSDNKARVWQISTGEMLAPPLEHNGTVAYAVFSSDSRQLLTIAKDNTVRLWELPAAFQNEDGKTIVQAPAPRATAMNSGGRQLTNLKDGNAVQVIDAVSKKAIGPPLRHRSTIEHAELSLDGRFVVTASADNTAQVWDALTGARVIPPCQHKSTVRYAAFSSDGRRLITASEDRTARVWDATTGEPLTPPLKRSRAVVSAYFSPDGRQAITECADGTRRSWNLVPDDRPVTTLVLLAEVLAGSRLHEKHGALPHDGESLRSAWQKLQSSEASAVQSSSK